MDTLYGLLGIQLDDLHLVNRYINHLSGGKLLHGTLQGFRVELGEIEHHARTFYKNERRVIAIAFQNTQNLTEIALFVEAAAEDSKELIAYLRSKMPSYMIPSRFIYVPSFPLNKSEKIDRNQLKARLK